MNLLGKEIAKFACGFESFHTVLHVFLWASNTGITIFGISISPAASAAATVISGAIAIGLGAYAWRRTPEDFT